MEPEQVCGVIVFLLSVRIYGLGAWSSKAIQDHFWCFIENSSNVFLEM